MAECLAPAYRKVATNKDAFDLAVDIAEAFKKCKAKHDALRKTVEEFNEPRE